MAALPLLKLAAQPPISLRQLFDVEQDADPRKMFAGTEIKEMAYCRFFGMITLMTFGKNMEFDSSGFPNLKPKGSDAIGLAYHGDWGSPRLVFNNRKWIADYQKEAQAMGFKVTGRYRKLLDEMMYVNEKYDTIDLTRKTADGSKEYITIILYKDIFHIIHGVQ